MLGKYNIYITGSSGFLGSVIKDVLENNSEVRLLNTNLNDGRRDLTKSISNISTIYDIVIHCAGKAHFKPKSNKDKEIFNEVNVNGTKNLLKSFELYPPKMFVFISSVSVYGLNIGVDIVETSPLLAKDSYGLSKINAEKSIIEWCKERKIKYSILRLPLVVAKNPPGNLGAMISAIKNGYYFNIGGGKANKSMVLAEDVAKYIILIAEKGGIYNLTDRQHTSFYLLSNYLAGQLGKKKIFNIPFFIANFLSVVGDFFGPDCIITSEKVSKITNSLTFNDDLAVKEFGWEPRPVLTSKIFD